MGNTKSIAARHKGAGFACEAMSKDLEWTCPAPEGASLIATRIRATAGMLRRLSPGAASLRIYARHNDWFMASGPSQALAKTTYNCCQVVASFKRMINPNNLITAIGSAKYG